MGHRQLQYYTNILEHIYVQLFSWPDMKTHIKNRRMKVISTGQLNTISDVVLNEIMMILCLQCE